MYLLIELPSTQQTIGYNLGYNDMFRLTRVIIRLCSEPMNALNIYVHFGIPKSPKKTQPQPAPSSNNYMLTLNLLMTTMVAPPSNASKWQMGFNSAFKGMHDKPTNTPIIHSVMGTVSILVGNIEVKIQCH